MSKSNKTNKIQSLTAFANVEGTCGSCRWSWDVRTVNAKSLDIRLRLPPGWESHESQFKSLIADKLHRGSLQATLTIEREQGGQTVKINTDVLVSVLAAIKAVSNYVEASPPTLDGILTLKGVLEYTEPEENAEDRAALEAQVTQGLGAALDRLRQMRGHEGGQLAAILKTRLEEIDALRNKAEGLASTQPDAIRKRLKQQVEALLASSKSFDADRLHQEAVLLAAKSDVREELDRLAAHVVQSQSLLAEGGAVGRRLDFLSQELHREANTLCSKSVDVELTNIGIGLKTLIEQFREQVQNIE